MPFHKVPLLGRFAGSASGASAQANTYYANVDDLDRADKRIKGLLEDGKRTEASALRTKTGPYLLAQANTAEREIRRLRKAKSELIAQGAKREKVKAVEERITQAMKRLNTALEARKRMQAG